MSYEEGETHLFSQGEAIAAIHAAAKPTDNLTVLREEIMELKKTA